MLYTRMETAGSSLGAPDSGPVDHPVPGREADVVINTPPPLPPSPGEDSAAITCA